MRLLFLVGISLLLAACGLSSPMIKSETLTFDDAIEDTTNKLLVLNILRARDQAPLHFAEIPSIHESIQQTASLSIVGYFGARNGSTSRDNATAGGSFQITPAFDVNHVDSKEFVTGIASPIDPKFVKYWLDRGLDRRLILLLFFSAAEITEVKTSDEASETTKITKIRVTNTPRESVDTVRARAKSKSSSSASCKDKSQFEFYLSLQNALKRFVATTVTDDKLIGTIKYDQEDSARFLQALAALVQSKVKIKFDEQSSTYKVYSSSGEAKVLFCFYQKNGSTGMTMYGNKKCNQSDDVTADDTAETPPPKQNTGKLVVLNSPADESTENEGDYCRIFDKFREGLNKEPEKNPTYQIQLQIRSVGEMIHFLGDLLYYQDALRDKDLKGFIATTRGELADLHNPVTLGYCPIEGQGTKDPASQGNWDILFNLDYVPAQARFDLTYRNRQYAVGKFNPPKSSPKPNSTCDEEFTSRKDHTLEVLSVVNQLVNLNKSATDLRTTPFVQILQ
jgi:hypothetical protein